MSEVRVVVVVFVCVCESVCVCLYCGWWGGVDRVWCMG